MDLVPYERSTYVWIGDTERVEPLGASLPGVRRAERFASWEDLRTSLPELERPVFAFGGPEALPELRSFYLPIPGVAIVAAGTPAEAPAGGAFGVDLWMPPHPDADALAAFKLLRRRMQFEAEALRAERDAKNALEAVAHDLRTPVTAIVAYTELLVSCGPEALQQDLRKILENAAVIEDLTSRLLAMNRAGEHAVPLRPKVIAPGEVLDRVLPIVSAECQARSIALRVSVSRDLPALWADPVAIRRVASNILDNAVRASPSGSTVSIEVARSGDSILFRFLDEGPGLSPELLSRVFMRYQSESGRTGLGLAIAWELVTLHSGVIWAENRPDRGASFSVLLPSVLREFTLFQSLAGSVKARAGSAGVSITLTGSFGREDAAQLRAALLAATEEAPAVTLDLSGCGELSSGSVATLVELSLESEARARPCEITGLSPALAPVLEAARQFREREAVPLEGGGGR